MTYSIRIQKEYLKFSAAHFTLFDSGREPLHGHNYQVGIELSSPTARDGFVVNFQPLKQTLRSVCDALDELILLPTTKRVQVSEQSGTVTVDIDGVSAYTFPKDEVNRLPVENITCESLAFYLTQETLKHRARWDPNRNVTSMRIWVEETPGQSGGYGVTFEPFMTV